MKMFGNTGSMTFPMSYDYEGEYYGYRKGWKALSSMEKSLSVSLGVLSALCVALMIAVIVVGVKLNKESDCKLVSHPTITPSPTRPPVITSTIPGDICNTTSRPRPERPSSTTTPSSLLDEVFSETNPISRAECILASEDYNNATICLTEQCFRKAGRMMESMDFSVNPCQNFFQFACGNWIKNNPIPDDKQSWDQHDLLRERHLKEIKHILETDPSPQDPRLFHLARDFYHSCMHPQDDEVGLAEMRLLLDELTSFDDNETDPVGSLVTVMGNIRRSLEGNYVISLEVGVDDKNTSANAIYLDHPTFGLHVLLSEMDVDPRVILDIRNNNSLKEMDSNNVLKFYQELVQQLWSLVFSQDIENVETIVSEILEFERNLTDIRGNTNDIDDPETMYNPLYEIDDTQLSPSMVSWINNFVDAVFYENLNTSTNAASDSGNKDKEAFTIIVKDVAYLRNLEKLLNETETEIIERYLKMRILLNYGPKADADFKNVFMRFKKKLLKKESCTPRWKNCAHQTNEIFGWMISTKYFQSFADIARKGQINQTVNYLKETLNENLDGIDWIASNETRLYAQQKLELMQTFLGFPQSWNVQRPNDEFHFVEDFYSDMNFTDSSNYFQNYIEAVMWMSKKRLSEIYQPTTIESDAWPKFDYPTKMESRYSHKLNYFELPAGIIDWSDLSMAKPFPSLHFSSLGMMIAEGILEGIIEDGRFRGDYGRIHSWWDNATEDNYANLSDCFQSQYIHFLGVENTDEDATEKMIKIRLKENLLENAALALAYQAYYSSSFDQEYGELLLPGLQDYTPEQLFFLSYAQSQCSAKSKQTTNGVSISPGKIRVESVLQNSPEFSKFWKCPRPVKEDTCRIFLSG